MIRRVALTVLAFVVLAGVTVGVSMIAPDRRPASAAVELPRTSSVTCGVEGEVLAVADSAFTSRSLSGAAGPVGVSPLAAPIEGPTALTSDGRSVAGVLTADDERTFLPCAAPSTSGVLLVPDPGERELLLINPDSGETVVDLTLLGPDGEITAVGARGIAIGPGASRRVALSVLAPEGPVGVAFEASVGRVAALAVAVEGRGTRLTAPAVASDAQVIPGIPGGVSSPRLLISNPGLDRVTIAVEVLGATGSYEPASAADQTIAPLSTLELDLGDDLGGDPGALRITADGEVAAAVVLDSLDGPPTTLTAGEESAELAGYGPSGGELQLSNPVLAEVTARLTGATARDVTVPAGATVAVEVSKTDRSYVTVEATGPLVGALVSPGEKKQGLAVAPLGVVGTAEDDSALAVVDPNLR
ncbi:MAG TPA: DUF5719 family protein [Arachnia sp.]|nr:DUF5719 family protein [Arachnia sp.]HMR13807.1 DUF5719 family protein [Arachnia sp.]